VLVYQAPGVQVTNNAITMAGETPFPIAVDLYDASGAVVTGNTIGDAAYGVTQGGVFAVALSHSGNTFTDVGVNLGFYDDDPKSAGFEVTGTDGGDEFIGGPGPDSFLGTDGADAIDGGGGADTLDGGAGADTLTGGDGIDQAVYAGSVTIAFDGEWGVDESADRLDSIEIIDDGGEARTLLVGGGGFTSIQAAVDAAQDGDTILIGTGFYLEQVQIDGKKDLLLEGFGDVVISTPTGVAPLAQTAG